MRAAAFICPNISSLRATRRGAQQLDEDLLGFWPGVWEQR